MKVLVLGSGGREHSICSALSKSKDLSSLWCIPGNAGIQNIAKVKSIDLDKNFQIVKFCKENNIDLVVPGSEIPLANGIVDQLNKDFIKAFGPSKEASKLESSKIFTKNLCMEANIPTAKWEIFKSYSDAITYLKNSNYPTVIKVDGLAAGKGVIIANNFEEAKEATDKCFSGIFGSAGKKIIIEEFLEGREASFFAICDGDNAIPFGNAQDYKRVGDFGVGPNTGGMGSYSPSPIIDSNLSNKIMETIITPTLRVMNKRNTPFKGFLYAGLMIKNQIPKLIEFNVRLGDPECQSILTRLKSDFLDLCMAGIEGKLKNKMVAFSDKKSLCVIMASKGYPGKYKKNLEIKGIEKVKHSNIFHAGTKYDRDYKLLTNGGRVLNFVTLSDTIENARKTIYNDLELVKWSGSFYRKDIGLDSDSH